MYLVELNKIGKVIIADDGVGAIPEFRDILETKGYGEPAMRVIALITDYHSPYRHRPRKDVNTFVIRDVFGRDAKKTIDLKSEKCKAAIKKYEFLQFDPYREELISTNKIIQISVRLKNGLDVTDELVLQQVLTYTSRIERFEKRLENLKKIIKDDGSSGPVKDAIPLFRLEQKLLEQGLEDENN
jgi:hypothetical protein